MIGKNGKLHGSFRNEQLIRSIFSEDQEAGESGYQNKPQTVVEAISYLLGHYDWQPGRESGANIIYL